MSVSDKVLEKISDIYDELKALPKPEPYSIGGTYYGSTQLVSSVGDHCDQLKGEPYTSYGYGCNINYKAIYGIRLGGAYKTDIIKKLTSFLDENREDLLKEGWALIKDYGTNFSVYGIAER